MSDQALDLLDLLDQQPEADPKHQPRTDFDGTAGTLTTGALTTAPADYNELLRQFGYDPEQVEIVGDPRVSRWQQRARDKGTGQFTTEWLSAYKFQIRTRAEELDLPALYAAVEATTARKAKSKAKDAKGKKAKGKAKGSAPRPGRAVVVAWADVQTGKVDHLGGVPELLERLEDKRARLREYLERERPGNIIVADAGDLIEGFDNVASQMRMNGLSLMDQVDIAAVELWKTLELCAEFAPVELLSIPSNHCAWRKSGSKELAARPGDDWGLHINLRLERQNQQAGLDATFTRAEPWEETLVTDVHGTRLGLAHGHQVSNPDQVKNWWAKMTHSGAMDCHVLLTGHFHFPSLRPSGRDGATGKARWHIQASTLDNGSAWVRNKMGEDGDPALTVFAIDSDGFDVRSYALL